MTWKEKYKQIEYDDYKKAEQKEWTEAWYKGLYEREIRRRKAKENIKGSWWRQLLYDLRYEAPRL